MPLKNSASFADITCLTQTSPNLRDSVNDGAIARHRTARGTARHLLRHQAHANLSHFQVFLHLLTDSI